MNRHPIVFLDAATFGDVSLQRFADSWDCTIHQVTGAGELIPRLAGKSVAVTNKVAMNGAVLSAAEARALRLIVVAATGTDIIDRDAAKNFGITVSNVPGYATQSVAQFTLTLILELATRAAAYRQDVNGGLWQKSAIFSLVDRPSIELNGKKLGIIGYGSIGQAVARMARALGMEVLVSVRPGSVQSGAPDRLPLEDLLRQADVVSLHCPLTEATRELINQRTLSLMKPTAFLINTARGALIDDEALVRALREKRLAGAALDVISREPPPNGHPIVEAAKELDNLWVTPHTAWSAREARERLLGEVAENIAGFFSGKPRNVVA
jgi:glycerate dehydrogenase